MKKNRGILLLYSTLLCVIVLSACASSTENSSTTLENPPQNNNSNQTTNDKSSENTPNDESDVSEKNTTDNQKTSEETDTSSNHTANDEKSSSTTSTEVSLKEKYQKIINETKKEAEELGATDSSTYALKKVEDDRWEMWDQLLNEIYGALKEQLSAEEMDQLKEEQRNWIKNRDKRALEASLKFKGGTQEHLEYTAVLANITEERCYELVEGYMK